MTGTEAAQDGRESLAARDALAVATARLEELRVLKTELEKLRSALSEGIDLRDNFFPLDQDQAVNWMEKYCNEKIEKYLEVPEAGDPSTTLTLRMDKALKILLNAASIKEGVSMNVWCVRVLEQAVAEEN